jgi:hypothetical protein
MDNTMNNADLDEYHYGDRFPELEEIGISDVKEELKNDCLPEHLLDAARVWLKLKARDRIVA